MKFKLDENLPVEAADYFGLIILRSKTQAKRVVLDLVRKFIPLLAMETLEGHLWIVETDRVRIR